MSRIGEAPIVIPSGATVEKTGPSLVVKGPQGELVLEVNPAVEIEREGDKLIVKRKSEDQGVKALHGLTRSLVANAITGVTDGWTKGLELHGVGFRAQTNGNKLTLSIGFSHPVEVEAPQGITFQVTDNTKIKVSGIDKYLVGQMAANIRAIRPPDVYKGKGVRYEGEYVRKKAGKSGKVGVAGGK